MSRWWRTGLSAVAALVLVSFGAAPADAVAVPDLRVAGPHEATVRTYDFGDSALTLPGVPGPVELRGVVHAPADANGGRFPLVLLVHGKAETCGDAQRATYTWPCPAGQTTIPSHRGYDYLAANLATHGYVVVSIGLNGINAGDSHNGDFGTAARSALIGRHLALWRQWNTIGGEPFGDAYVGAIDQDRVGLMGHSRGGEAIVTYAKDHPGTADGFRIGALMALAPTDILRRTVTGVPLAVVLPLCDSEVYDLQGVHYVDDTRYAVPGDTTPRYLVTVAGANHAFFNSVWSPEGGAPGAHDDAGWNSPGATCHPGAAGRLTEAQQRLTGLTSVNGFFRYHLGDERSLRPMWTGDTPVPDWADADVQISRHPGDSPAQRLVVNKFGAVADLTRNGLGGAVTAAGPVGSAVCAAIRGGTRTACMTASRPLVLKSEPHANWSASLSTPMVKLAWTGAGAALTNELPAAAADLSGYAAVQFRTALDFSDTLNQEGAAQDLSVVLVDGAGASARVPVGAHTRALRFPALAPSTVTFDASPHFLLRQVRVPLPAFDGIDLTDVRSISLAFDGPSTGSLGLSDLLVTD